MSTKKILDSVFEGHNLTAVIIDGKVSWPASEISLALGYKKGCRISNLIREKWSDEFEDGVHCMVIKSGDVGFENLQKRFSKKARFRMFLTEPPPGENYLLW